ncbi:MAG: dihydrofolate synthase / folylpolyglutamate synthase [Gaiellaceae bacterium]|jgi:dihydrofolate synthase/folylpolyglutamate synthase|nr:dihydrofolate synthase / folylpolyglutamate synthase [Gaiellaceae bacterium]
MPSAAEATRWVETLSPWPTDGFGTERMRALLARLGNPERSFEAVHVVGTKGKSTAARRIAATIDGAAYTSPHVSGWHERLDTDEAGFERAVQRVRRPAEELGATQFEVVTAAAFADFAARGVAAAAVEAGLGGRLDATNVIDARVVLLTNVALEHTEVLGETREQIAAEKLAVAGPGAVVVLPDEEFAHHVARNEIRIGGAREAAEAFLGRPVELAEASLPGRLELREGEVRDGAHTPEAVDWLLDRLPRPHDYVVVASILGDKDVDAILERLARAGRTLVATRSSNDRALPAGEVADRARTWFTVVESADDPHEALRRAHILGDRVLVTGSLYLLADLSLLAETGRDE